MGKRELVALLCLSSWCLVIVVTVCDCGISWSYSLTIFQLNQANSFDTEVPFLDLDLSIRHDIDSSKTFDKRDGFKSSK